MPSLKKLALIATETQGKTSAETVETADTAMEPKTIPPPIFQKRREVIIVTLAFLKWRKNWNFLSYLDMLFHMPLQC